MEILINATPEELEQLSKRDCTAPAEKNCKGFINNIPSVPVDASSSIRLSAATALAAGILDNRKKILNPANTDEYLDVVHEIMRLVKAYCKAVEQDIKEGDSCDKRAKGT